MNLSETRDIVFSAGIHPRKFRGQNFLIDKNIIKKIIAAADLRSDDAVLEIGPGLGALTSWLAEAVGQVTAVEVDKIFYQLLIEKFGDNKKIKIINEDILKFDLSSFPERDNYKIVANLPYRITSPILFKFLRSDYPPRNLIIMAQKEVAERMTARPPRMNLLALLTRFYAQPKICFTVPRGCFWPRPKVDSAVVKLDLFAANEKKYSAIDSAKLFALFKFGFAMKRKKLINNLWQGINRDELIFSAAERRKFSKDWLATVFRRLNLDTNIRAEELDLIAWQNILKNLTIEE